MKKVALFLFAAIALVACKPDHGKDPDTVVTEFTISNPDVDLKLGDGVQLMYEPDEAYGQITWSSDKEQIATVDSEKGYITAVGVGDAVITGKLPNGFTATANVSVLSDQQYFIDNTEFYELGTIGATKYGFKFKNKDGNPLTCGDVAADPNFPKKDAPVDSVIEFRYLLFDRNLYFGGDGAVTGLPGIAIEFHTSCYYSPKGEAIFSLARYDFVSLDSIYENYKEKYTEDEMKEMTFTPPYYAPVTQFDEKLFLEYAKLLFAGEKPSLGDMPYMGPEGEKATRMIRFYNIDGGLGYMDYGVIDQGVYASNQDKNEKVFTEQYILTGKFFGGTDVLGLKTEYKTVEEDGVEKDGYYYVMDGDNYVMEEMVPFEFQNVPAESSASSKAYMGAVSPASVEKQVAVNRAMYMPMIQVFDNHKAARINR